MGALGLKNTTNAYERTSVFPFDPFALAWTEAIESLGGVENAKEHEHRPKVQYEVLGKKEDLPIISDDDKRVLREGLTLDPLIIKTDLAVALIRGGEILSIWRKAIQEAVSEGENYEAFSCALLPQSTATCEAHRVAMKLIQFEFVDIFCVPLPVKPTKEERNYMTSVRIVQNTKMWNW